MATDNKYDRQLRLWGAKGQRALAETTVLLIRATAAGTETLKNLVLPGIGQIFVLDDVLVSTEEDASSNFFVSNHSSNNNNNSNNNNSNCEKTRAQVAMELLQELNPDVKGRWKHVNGNLQKDLDWKEFLSSSARAASNKLLVVGADLEPPLARTVSSVCHELRLSLVHVQSYGLIGTVRLQTPPLPILDPKPDSELPDLRLVHPIPAVQELFQEIGRCSSGSGSRSRDTNNWEHLTNQEHGHVPYPLVLLKVVQEWKDKTDSPSGSGGGSGNLPSNFDEKQQFRSMIAKTSRNWNNELNFQEAASNAYLAYTERTLNLERLQELQTVAATETEQCPNLYALLQALDQFLQQNNGQAPLQGNIPDMTASTELYVKLQTAYQNKAAEDMQNLRRLLPSHIAISNEELETFCKNIFNLDLLQTRTLVEEQNNHDDSGSSSNTQEEYPEDLLEDLVTATFDPYEVKEHTPLLWYFCLRACHVYWDLHGKYPGVGDADASNSNCYNYKDDVAELQNCIDRVVSAYRIKDNELVQQTLLSKTNDQAYATEMTRYANAQIHNIASVMGGVASQEAVKIITGIYVPLNNTYVFNGIASTCGVYKF